MTIKTQMVENYDPNHQRT